MDTIISKMNSYTFIHFRIYRINQDMYKLIRKFMLIKKKKAIMFK